MKIVRLIAVAAATSLLSIGVLSGPAHAGVDTSWGYVSGPSR